MSPPNHQFWITAPVRALAMGLLALLVGCATGPTADPRDPLEPFNRGVWQFNDTVDRAVVRPAATAYRDVLPSPVRTGITNFFHNLQDAWSVVNNALQLKGEAAANSFFRFGVNTAFGLGGVLDIACRGEGVADGQGEQATGQCFGQCVHVLLLQ